MPYQGSKSKTSYEGIAGIAWGATLGTVMVAIALAFGISVFFAPMRFAPVPRQLLVMPALGWQFSRPYVFGTVLVVALGMADPHRPALGRWNPRGAVSWFYRWKVRGPVTDTATTHAARHTVAALPRRLAARHTDS